MLEGLSLALFVDSDAFPAVASGFAVATVVAAAFHTCVAYVARAERSLAVAAAAGPSAGDAPTLANFAGNFDGIEHRVDHNFQELQKLHLLWQGTAMGQIRLFHSASMAIWQIRFSI